MELGWRQESCNSSQQRIKWRQNNGVVGEGQSQQASKLYGLFCSVRAQASRLPKTSTAAALAVMLEPPSPVRAGRASWVAPRETEHVSTDTS